MCINIMTRSLVVKHAASDYTLRFQAFIIFKSSDSLKIHFRGWSKKWDEDISVLKFESRLRPRSDGTAVGAEHFFETFDDVASEYNCRKFGFCTHADVERPSSPRGSAESSGSHDASHLAIAGTYCQCEEIDACDQAGQWYSCHHIDC
jgi:hypothetical protein